MFESNAYVVGVVWCVVWCVLVCVCVFDVRCVRCGTRKNLEKPVRRFRHASVCAFKTSPSVPATGPHVSTRVDVVPVHTGTFGMYTRRRVGIHTRVRESEREEGERKDRNKKKNLTKTKLKRKRVSTCTRGPLNNRLILPIECLRAGREQHVPDLLGSFALPDKAPLHLS